MKNVVLFISIISSSLVWSNPYNCTPLIAQGNMPQFLECIQNICGTSQNEAQFKSCALNNVIIPDPDPTNTASLHALVMQKYNSYQAEMVTCNSHQDCIGEGKGCYESSPSDVISEEKVDYVTTLSYFLNYPPEARQNGQPCSRNSDCQSFSCRTAPTQVSMKVCTQPMFCRKAHFAETAPGAINCEEGLVKDSEGKCRSQHFMEDRARQLVRMSLNQTNSNVCNPNDPAMAEFYTRLKSQNFNVRAFEFLFADSQTTDIYQNINKLRNIAKKLREKRLILVKNLNKANDKFTEEFLTIKNLKATSSASITFRGQQYVESDLYAQAVENGIALDLMTDLENIRSDYNKELAKLYLETSDKFPAIIESFYRINPNRKKGSGFRPFNLKNKRQWKHQVVIANNTKKYLEEFNEGRTLEIINQIYPQASGMLSGGSKFKEMPIDFNTQDLKKLKAGSNSGRFTDGKTTLKWFPKRAIRIEKDLFKKLSAGYEKNLTDTFKESENTKWDELIDPELRFYTGCFKEEAIVPEDKKKSYCGTSEKIMQDLQSHQLAHAIIFGASGSGKHYPGNFFSGDRGNSSQSNSSWIHYSLESGRGNYFKHIYENFLLIGEAYQSLSDTKEIRIACLNKNRMGPGAGGLLYSQYNNYDPNGQVFTGTTSGIANSFSPNGSVSSLSPSSSSGTNLTSSGNQQLSSTELTEGNSVNLSASSARANSENKNPSELQINSITNNSYTKKSQSYGSKSKPGAGFDWDADLGSSEGFSELNRSGSSLSTEEAQHVMKNLNNYEAPAPAQDTIFETISNSYVDNAYPAIFSE